MREIKFRAWDGDLEEYIDYTGLDIPVESLNNSNTLIWEQFTGLYDATKWEDLTEDERTEWTRHGNFPSEWKGKEIYEGDICLFPSGKHRCFVFDKGAFGYRLQDGEFCSFSRLADEPINCYGEPFKITLVGNIHENPELLK